MTTELYVGNLSSNTTEDELRTLFAPIGELTEVIIMLDPDTGRSKGFGYIGMKTSIAATDAIKRVNGQMLDKHKLLVKKSVNVVEMPLKGASGGSLRNFRGGGRGRM